MVSKELTVVSEYLHPIAITCLIVSAPCLLDLFHIHRVFESMLDTAPFKILQSHTYRHVFVQLNLSKRTSSYVKELDCSCNFSEQDKEFIDGVV